MANLINFYSAVSTSIPVTDPLQLNSEMIGKKGYDSYDDIVWDQVGHFAADSLVLMDSPDVDLAHSRTYVASLLDADLAQRRPVIVRGEYPPEGSGNLHFMLAIGKCRDKYVVMDPNSGVRLYAPDEMQLLLRGVRRYAFEE